MTIKEAINQGTVILKNENIESPKVKARILMQHTLNKSREYTIIYDNKQLTNDEREKYIRNIRRLASFEPLQYITGSQEFMKLNFFVNKNVLVPRQDTEILVEEAIRILKEMEEPTVLDMCTGSGAIAISIAKYVPNVKVVAVDISKPALEVATKNAKTNAVLRKIEFIESNLFKKLKGKKFDMIISNPPYIASNIMKKLPRDVQNEPQLALDGGKDGLDFYKTIIEEADKYLNGSGTICMEIGYDQKKALAEIIEKSGKYKETYFKKDLCENDRVVVTKLK